MRRATSQNCNSSATLRGRRIPCRQVVAARVCDAAPNLEMLDITRSRICPICCSPTRACDVTATHPMPGVKPYEAAMGRRAKARPTKFPSVAARLSIWVTNRRPFPGPGRLLWNDSVPLTALVSRVSNRNSNPNSRFLVEGRRFFPDSKAGGVGSRRVRKM